MATQLGRAYIPVDGDWTRFNRSLKSQSYRLNSQFSQLGTGLGRSLTRATGLALKAGAVTVGAGLVYAVKSAANFEQQMSSLGAAANANAKQMEALRKQAIKAGAATKFSAKEAADAQTELAKGGLSVRQMLKGGLNSALSLAAAGQLDLAEAASTTVNAMKLFGIRGKDSVKVADGFATAANKTTADVHDFAMALTQGGSAAKTAGLDFKGTTAWLEALADAGIKGSDAGTSLKSTLAQMVQPYSVKLQQQLGISLFDSAGNMRDLADVSGDLQQAFGDLTKEERLATASRLAGTDGMRALLALYDAGPAKLEKYQRQLDKQGTAQDVAKKKMDNLKGSMEQLHGSVDTLGIQIGTAMTPAIREATDDLTKFANETGRILARDDLSLNQKLERVFDTAKVDAKPWIDKIDHALDEADIPEHLADAVSAATPKIASALGHGAALGAETFARTFTHSNAWGKLVIGGWLLAKMGGLRGFAGVGRQAGTAMATGAATSFRSRLGSGLKGLGKRVIGVDLAMNLVDSKGDPITSVVNTAHDLTFGLVPKMKTDDEKTAEILGRSAKALDDLTRKRDLSGLRALAAAQRRAADAADILGTNERSLQLEKRADEADAAARKIQRSFDQPWLNEIRHNWKEFGDSGAKGMRSVRNAVEYNTEVIKDRIKGDTDISRRALHDNFQQGAHAVAEQMGITVRSVRRAMEAGKTDTRKGAAQIRAYLVQALMSLGLSNAQATSKLTRGTIQSGARVPGQAGDPGAARGGLFQFGAPGQVGPDSIPARIGRQNVVVAPGEVAAVFNRHQLPEINARLADQGGLPGFFRRNNKPHHMARGGVIPSVQTTLAGGPGALANTGLQRVRDAAQEKLERAAEKLTAAAGGLGKVGPQPSGLGTFDGKQVANWIIPILNWARKHGWGGTVTSGFRPGAITSSGNRSNHSMTSYPGGAIDVGGPGAVSEGLALWSVIQNYPGMPKLYSAAYGPRAWGPYSDSSGTYAHDYGHFSATGHARGGLIPFNGGGIVQGPPQFDRRFPSHSLANAQGKFRFSPGQIKRLAGMVGLPPEQMEQIAHGESQYYPGIISWDKGYGLWQMTPRVWGAKRLKRLAKLGGTGAMLNAWRNALMARYLYGQAGNSFADWRGTAYLHNTGTGPPLGPVRDAQGKPTPTSVFEPKTKPHQPSRHLSLAKSIAKGQLGDPRGLIKRIRNLGLPEGIVTGLQNWRKGIALAAEGASRAELLTVEPDTSWIGEDTTIEELQAAARARGIDPKGMNRPTLIDRLSDPIQGVYQGKQQAQWILGELIGQMALRKLIIRAREVAEERREETERLIARARERLVELVAEVRTTTATQHHLEDEEKALNRQITKAEEHPKHNADLIRQLKARLHQVKDRLRGVKGHLATQTDARDNLKTKVLPALTGKRENLIELRGKGRLLGELQDLQGIGSPMGPIKGWPPLGTFGGSILENQLSWLELTKVKPALPDEPADTSTDDSGGGAEESPGAAALAENLAELLRQANLRTAVSEAQYRTLRDLPPYVGRFHSGGVIPGPVGAERTAIVQSGEVVQTREQAQDPARVRVVVEDHRTRVYVDDVEQIVHQTLRRETRLGNRPLPGRGGGGLA